MYSLLVVSSKIPLDVGEEVLSRGSKRGETGDHRHMSSIFNGKVQAIELNDSHEYWIYVD